MTRSLNVNRTASTCVCGCARMIYIQPHILSSLGPLAQTDSPLKEGITLYLSGKRSSTGRLLLTDGVEVSEPAGLNITQLLFSFPFHVRVEPLWAQSSLKSQEMPNQADASVEQQCWAEGHFWTAQSSLKRTAYNTALENKAKSSVVGGVGWKSAVNIWFKDERLHSTPVAGPSPKFESTFFSVFIKSLVMQPEDLLQALVGVQACAVFPGFPRCTCSQLWWRPAEHRSVSI